MCYTQFYYSEKIVKTQKRIKNGKKKKTSGCFCLSLLFPRFLFSLINWSGKAGHDGESTRHPWLPTVVYTYKYRLETLCVSVYKREKERGARLLVRRYLFSSISLATTSSSLAAALAVSERHHRLALGISTATQCNKRPTFSFFL